MLEGILYRTQTLQGTQNLILLKVWKKKKKQHSNDSFFIQSLVPTKRDSQS